MASRNKINKVQGWLTRQYRIDFSDVEFADDWGRAFDKLTDAQMDSGVDGVEEFYNNSTFPPTTAIFLKYAKGSAKTISSSMRFNPWDHWTDDEGREMAGPPGSAPTQPTETGRGKYTISRAEGAKRISDYLKTIRGVVAESNGRVE